jgi:hypothetical protein
VPVIPSYIDAGGNTVPGTPAMTVHQPMGMDVSAGAITSMTLKKGVSINYSCLPAYPVVATPDGATPTASNTSLSEACPGQHNPNLVPGTENCN